MRASGSAPLAAAVAVLWALVWLLTQEAPTPALDVRWTLLIGTSLSVAAILGYPSALRGPRTVRPSRGRRPGDGALDVIGRAAPALRQGLTAETAQRTVELLRPLLDAEAVALTDRERVLAFIGPGADHHGPGTGTLTAATRRVLSTGRAAVLEDPYAIGCDTRGCPLVCGAVAPLTVRGEVVGALKLYRTTGPPPTSERLRSMATILSLHLELADLDRQRELAANARLETLRAQINPHFLFNILNTITSKARTSPEEARRLLVQLSDFFRYAMQQTGQVAEFAQEYFFVRTYVALEQARYGDRLEVRYDVDPQALSAQIPVLVLQPLVENAVKHGLAPKPAGGCVLLRARVDPLARALSLEVRDDGVGMDVDAVRALIDRDPSGAADGDRAPGPAADGPSNGLALANIRERLWTLFGERCSLELESTPGRGAAVRLRLPLQ